MGEVLGCAVVFSDRPGRDSREAPAGKTLEEEKAEAVEAGP